jgi:DNA-binding beta-propeller fold protein YncE
VTFSADGAHALLVATTDSGNTAARAIDLANSRVVGTPIAIGGSPTTIEVNDDGTVAVVHTDDESSVTVIDVNGHSVTVAVPNGQNYTATFSSDGRRLYIAADIPDPVDPTNAHHTAVTVVALAPAGETVIKTLTANGGPVGPVVLSDDGTRAFVETYIFPTDRYLVTSIDTGTISTQIV